MPANGRWELIRRLKVKLKTSVFLFPSESIMEISTEQQASSMLPLHLQVCKTWFSSSIKETDRRLFLLDR